MTSTESPILLDHYSSISGEHLGSTVLEFYEDGTPKLVSFSTPRRAPAYGPGQMAIFLDEAGKPPILEPQGSWCVVADLRGTKYWTADGTEVEIRGVGVVVPPGGLLEKPEPVYTDAERAKLAGQAVSRMLDVIAESWQYTSYISARTYVGDPSPKYDAEARALVAFGSACYTLLDQIAAGELPEPADAEALLAMLPSPPARPVV